MCVCARAYSPLGPGVVFLLCGFACVASERALVVGDSWASYSLQSLQESCDSITEVPVWGPEELGRSRIFASPRTRVPGYEGARFSLLIRHH